jgi:hypothetical protein
MYCLFPENIPPPSPYKQTWVFWGGHAEKIFSRGIIDFFFGKFKVHMELYREFTYVFRRHGYTYSGTILFTYNYFDSTKAGSFCNIISLESDTRSRGQIQDVPVSQLHERTQRSTGHCKYVVHCTNTLYILYLWLLWQWAPSGVERHVLEIGRRRV